jgi:cytochrome oxidase Cu insertion factor (SCO1/SenC/PrrC family)
MSWAAAGGILLAGVGAYAYFQMEGMRRKKEALAKLEKSVGEAQVGGPFTLKDTSGKNFSSSQLHGEFSVLYFGFTHCPDICPDELEKLGLAIDLVGAAPSLWKVWKVYQDLGCTIQYSAPFSGPAAGKILTLCLSLCLTCQRRHKARP